MNNNANTCDFNLSSYTVRIISEACMALEQEIESEIAYLNKLIGTAYYDGLGDELMQAVVKYLTHILIYNKKEIQ
jgi:hypothetical protein